MRWDYAPLYINPVFPGLGNIIIIVIIIIFIIIIIIIIITFTIENNSSYYAKSNWLTLT